MSDLLRERAARIRLAVFDVDGVFTDGRLIYGPEGEQLKTFHVRDGLGIKQVLKAGIAVAVISGRSSAAVSRRMQELGIAHVFQGVDEKRPVLEKLLQTLGVRADETACVGDDVPDLALFERAGLPIAVADAHPEVRAKAAWVTTRPGGDGAVREVCDLLLSAQEHRA